MRRKMLSAASFLIESVVIGTDPFDADADADADAPIVELYDYLVGNNNYVDGLINRADRLVSMVGKRRYDEGCAVAHALDLIGERWALLIVRELLLGPKR